jgi:hypothetical protein
MVLDQLDGIFAKSRMVGQKSMIVEKEWTIPLLTADDVSGG